MTDQTNPNGVEPDVDRSLGRRGLLRSGALGGAASLMAATAGQALATPVAPPSVDTSFADFSLIKINSDDDSLSKVQQKGLVVGTSNDWPYSFLDPKTGEWTGLDGDIIKYVVKMLKIPKIDVQTATFDGLIPGLLDGRFDILGDSIHYTKNRSKVVNLRLAQSLSPPGQGLGMSEPQSARLPAARIGALDAA